jgi:WYL domain
MRDQHRYKASSARAQSRLVASLTRVPVAASRPIARRLDAVLESLAFTAPAGEFPPRTPGPAPYRRCGAPSPADLDQVHRRRRPAQRVLSGVAKAPCRHQVILRIQGTAEQIRAKLPASVASVEESPSAAGADPQTERWLRVELRAERLDWLPPALASLDLPFIIERPDELRGLVTALADRLATSARRDRLTYDGSP